MFAPFLINWNGFDSGIAHRHCIWKTRVHLGGSRSCDLASFVGCMVSQAHKPKTVAVRSALQPMQRLVCNVTIWIVQFISCLCLCVYSSFISFIFLTRPLPTNQCAIAIWSNQQVEFGLSDQFLKVWTLSFIAILPWVLFLESESLRLPFFSCLFFWFNGFTAGGTNTGDGHCHMRLRTPIWRCNLQQRPPRCKTGWVHGGVQNVPRTE